MINKLLILTLILFLLSCDINSSSRDKEFRHKIIGKWSAEYQQPYAYGEGEYFSNGQFKGYFNITESDGSIKKLVFHDYWNIDKVN